MIRNRWKYIKLVYGRWAYLFMGLFIGALLFSGVAVAQSYMGEVSQGQGGKKGAWLVGGAVGGTGAMHSLNVDATGALAVTGSSNATTVALAPGVPAKITLSASTSGCACGLTATRDYEISCTVDVAFRHGAATPTATLDDNQLRAGAIRSPMRIPTGSTCWCAVSTSAGACFVALIPTS